MLRRRHTSQTVALMVISLVQDEAWFAAAELHKLELLLNVATLGYAALWLDIDSIVFRNPLPHLLALDADLALPDARCASRDDRSPAERPAAAPGAGVELSQASGASMYH